MGVPPNGWFLRETPIKIADWGVVLFQENPMGKPQHFYHQMSMISIRFPMIPVTSLHISVPKWGYP